ncbi:MAG: phenylacetic acid degradation protein [Crocinitomicaceae bacterium]|nr:phenylacetic acid degradation protein [Crocinitomicaceae bacterium]|tara:strand:+ start:32865 stop:33938 length:1074 start_codon:yes stop_codon:yes gene_type:complete
MRTKFHSLKIKDVKKETNDTVSISFAIPEELQEKFKFESGQYLTLETNIDNEKVRRSYSLCSSPFEGEWRVAIKKVDNGKFSTYANNTLKKDMVLDVMEPAGNFKLSTQPNSENSYVFFAAGSGITPIISIIKSVLNGEQKSNVTLFYGNKGFNSIIFNEEINALKNNFLDKFRIIHVFSRENIGNDIQNGRIDKEKTKLLFDAFLKNTKIDKTFICGPESMILDVKEALTEKGLNKEQILFELFTSPSKEKKKIDSSKEDIKLESNISVIIDDEKIDFYLTSNGEFILDAAQKEGADLPYACKGGVCCTCKAKILKGSAKMDLNYALTDSEVKEGYILTCQAHPVTDELIISFDDV